MEKNSWIRPATDETRGDWQVLVDGKQITPGTVEIRSAKFGTVFFGLRPEGWTGWLYKEPGGGGAVTLPFCQSPTGILLVGLLREKRLNLGQGKTLCIMGGIINKADKDKGKTQQRESREESGLDTKGAAPIAGKPFVPDRLQFVADVEHGEGVQAYALEVPFEHLISTQVDGIRYRFRLRPGFLDTKRESELVFLPWREAARQSADAVALSAILRLLAEVDLRTRRVWSPLL